MSFNNNTRPDRTPGIINGNPMNGLCERVAIQATKIFDAGIEQVHLDNVSITVSNLSPAEPAPTEPLTFLSARSMASRGVVTDLKVTPLQNCTSRVTCNVVIPVEVLFTDSTNTTYSGSGSVTVQKDVVMKVPVGSLMPYEVIATVNLLGSEGTWTDGTDFTISFCATTILKIVMDVEALIPCYGYCFIPTAQDYQEEVCEGLFDLPLYPTNCRRRN